MAFPNLIWAGAVAATHWHRRTAGRRGGHKLWMVVPLDTVGADNIQAKLARTLDVEAVGLTAVLAAEAVAATPVVKLVPRLILAAVVETAGGGAGGVAVSWLDGEGGIAAARLG